MASKGTQRKLTAILSANVAGYSSRMEADHRDPHRRPQCLWLPIQENSPPRNCLSAH